MLFQSAEAKHIINTSDLTYLFAVLIDTWEEGRICLDYNLRINTFICHPPPRIEVKNQSIYLSREYSNLWWGN